MDKKQVMKETLLKISKTIVEVDGERHHLVVDPYGDPFFGCKQCSLRELCMPSDLLCEELGRCDCHYEKIDKSDVMAEQILFGY